MTDRDKTCEAVVPGGGHSVYLLMIVLCLPFISPMPVPGLSNAVWIIIAWLTVQLAFAHSPEQPGFLGWKDFSTKASDRLLRARARMIGRLEKVARPRCSVVFRPKPVA